jgi:hypothetical protein
MLLFVLLVPVLSSVVNSKTKWWSSLHYQCGQGERGEHYKLPERECIQSFLVAPLKTIDPQLLRDMKSILDLEMDFECIKRTVHHLKYAAIHSASMGFSSVRFIHGENNGILEPRDFEKELKVTTPLLSCNDINDCDLYIHGVQQEIVYMFKGSRINISKSDAQLTTLEIVWSL